MVFAKEKNEGMLKTPVKITIHLQDKTI